MSRKNSIPKFVPTQSGLFSVWEHPIPGEKYVVGIDTATGLSTDYTSMSVYNCRLPKFRQVAHLRAKIGITKATDYADRLGRFYNNALIVPEANHCGSALIDGLIVTYKYPRLYQGEQHLSEDPDISTKFGFYTLEATKWMLIRQMEKALIDKTIEIVCEITLTELGQFVYLEDRSKTGAPSGFNDDSVISSMLALHGCILYPQRAIVTSVKQTLSDDQLQQRAMMDRFNNQIFSKMTNNMRKDNIKIA